MPSVPKKPGIRLAFIGHPDLDHVETKRLVKKYFDRYSIKYNVILIVTIKDDPIGVMARRLAKFMDIEKETVDRVTNERNLLPMELTVATTMWAADRFILVASSSKKTYSFMAQEMCERMPRRYILTK